VEAIWKACMLGFGAILMTTVCYVGRIAAEWVDAKKRRKRHCKLLMFTICSTHDSTPDWPPGWRTALMDFRTLECLRLHHPAWRLLRADLGPMIASFLDRVFLQPNVRQMSESDLARHLDDDLFKLRRELGEDRFPREARAYLDDWASDKNGWLRKRYVVGSDEAQFDITPATEAALTWLSGLGRRSLISTESRLRTVFDLLRDLINGTEPNSLLMDRQTLLTHRAQWSFEAMPQTAELDRLDTQERALYDDIRFDRLGSGVRLEQERIPFSYVYSCIPR
jgi:hypothetical protein